MPGFEEIYGESAPTMVLELNRLHNQLKEKERELGKAQSEIRALKATELLKDKSVAKLVHEVKISNERIRFNEKHIEQKNLEIKKLMDEKREAMAAQYAVEATLRRVYADKKEDHPVPIELLAPLEAELKILKNQIAALQEDKRALERLMKSKEIALLESEKSLRSALERSLIVEEVQNQNFELKRQIEICQEENKVMDKTNRQKVLEVEKLSETIKELEEAILAGAAAANTIRDYGRQISELNVENRTLQRELSRIKVSTNRIATVVAKEWKGDQDRVISVKQWLDERRVMQAEIEKLKEKLALSDRTAQTEARIKEKLKLRLMTLEEGLKDSNFCAIHMNNTKARKEFQSQARASEISKNSGTDENQVLCSIYETMKPTNGSKKKKPYNDSALKNALRDENEKENEEMNENYRASDEMGVTIIEEANETERTSNNEMKANSNQREDMVSGFLYDRLQKEVIQLRKSCQKKDSYLSSKEDEIELLVKKIDILNRAFEVESKKMRKDVIKRGKISAPTIKDENNSSSAQKHKRSATLSTSLSHVSLDLSESSQGDKCPSL